MLPTERSPTPGVKQHGHSDCPPGGGHCTSTHQACLSATAPASHLMPGDLRLCLCRSTWWASGAALPSRSSSHRGPYLRGRQPPFSWRTHTCWVDAPREAGRLWAGPRWGPLGRNKGKPEAWAVGCADTPPRPPLRVPQTRPGSPDVFSIRMQPSSFCFIHLYSKDLIKASLHRAEEGNDRPQSPRRLPFISIFLSKTRGEGRGGPSWRKNKNSWA